MKDTRWLPWSLTVLLGSAAATAGCRDNRQNEDPGIVSSKPTSDPADRADPAGTTTGTGNAGAGQAPRLGSTPTGAGTDTSVSGMIGGGTTVGATRDGGTIGGGTAGDASAARDAGVGAGARDAGVRGGARGDAGTR